MPQYRHFARHAPQPTHDDAGSPRCTGGKRIDLVAMYTIHAEAAETLSLWQCLTDEVGTVGAAVQVNVADSFQQTVTGKFAIVCLFLQPFHCMPRHCRGSEQHTSGHYRCLYKRPSAYFVIRTHIVTLCCKNSGLQHDNA